MQAGGILRRDQHEKYLRRFAVKRIEIDALGMTPERSDYFGDAAQLAVRDCDSVANRRRAQPLALGQHRGQIDRA